MTSPAQSQRLEREQLTVRRWHMLAVRDSLKAMVPFQNRIRATKRRLLPYRTELANDQLLLDQALHQLRMIRDSQFDLEGKTVLEIGSGWNPVLPLLWRAAGASLVILTDRERLLDTRLVAAGVDYIRANCAALERALGSRAAANARTLPAPTGDIHSMMSQLGMRYEVPYDWASCEVPIGCFCSFGLSLRDWKVRPNPLSRGAQPNEHS